MSQITACDCACEAELHGPPRKGHRCYVEPAIVATQTPAVPVAPETDEPSETGVSTEAPDTLVATDTPKLSRDARAACQGLQCGSTCCDEFPAPFCTEDGMSVKWVWEGAPMCSVETGGCGWIPTYTNCNFAGSFCIDTFAFMSMESACRDGLCRQNVDHTDCPYVEICLEDKTGAHCGPRPCGALGERCCQRGTCNAPANVCVRGFFDSVGVCRRAPTPRQPDSRTSGQSDCGRVDAGPCCSDGQCDAGVSTP